MNTCSVPVHLFLGVLSKIPWCVESLSNKDGLYGKFSLSIIVSYSYCNMFMFSIKSDVGIL